MITSAAPATLAEAERHARIGVVRPRWQELLIVFAAALVSLVGVSWGTSVPQVLNVIAPVLLSIGLAQGVIAMVRADPASVWAPLLWVRIVMIAYSGVGSVIPFIANDTTLDAIDRFFTLYPVDMMKYNAVVAVFTLAMLMAARLTCWMFERRATRGSTSLIRIQPCALDAKQFGIVALLVAMPVKILFRWIPFITGTEINIPATVLLIATLSYIAYPLLIYHALGNDRRLLWLALPLVLIEVAMGALTFNKSEALFPLIFAFLGLLYHRPSFRRVMIGGGAIIFVYWLLVPVTTFGRHEQYRETGQLESPMLSRSLSIVQRYDGPQANRRHEDLQGNLLRFTYITGGSYAISQYDQGLPGGTLENPLAILVPRLIWPDKPDMTRVFRDFNYALTGSDESQSGPGIPPEAYWDYGWPGVLVVASIMGVAYALWSFYAVATLKAGAWHLLFVSLLGIRVAARIDGLIVTDFIPMIPIAIMAHMLLSFSNQLLVARKSKRQAVPPGPPVLSGGRG